jgi:hypothetical protein
LTQNNAENPEHKRLVKALVEYFSRNGYRVNCAACDGYSPCPEIEGCVPDVVGETYKGLVAIGEAKTSDDLENERTDDQFRKFSRQKMSQGSLMAGMSVPFFLGTTRCDERYVVDALKRLGLYERTNIRIIGL